MDITPDGPHDLSIRDKTDDVSPSKLDTETKNRATGGLAKNPYKEYSKATEQEYGFNNMYASSSRNYRDIRDMR